MIFQKIHYLLIHLFTLDALYPKLCYFTLSYKYFYFKVIRIFLAFQTQDMDAESLRLAERLLPSTYIKQAREADTTRRVKIHQLLEKVKP